MDKAEFDKFAEEYTRIHQSNIRASRESPDFFAEYKIADIAGETSHSHGNLSILDFGSGVGNSIPHVQTYFPASKLTCLDVSRKSLNIAKQRFGDVVDYVHFDGVSIPQDDDSYDIAYAMCVFHHIDKPTRTSLVREIRRVLKPNGRFYIFEHNPLNPLTVHAVNTCPFDENAALINSWSAKKLLENCCFNDISTKYRIFFPGAMKALRPLERYMTWLPLGAQYYVRASK